MYSGDNNKYPPPGHAPYAPNLPPSAPGDLSYPSPQNAGYPPIQNPGYPPPTQGYPGPPPSNPGYGPPPPAGFQGYPSPQPGYQPVPQQPPYGGYQPPVITNQPQPGPNGELLSIDYPRYAFYTNADIWT